MAGAITRGLIASGADASTISVTTRSAASAEAWRAEGVRAFSLEEAPDANAAAVEGAAVVLLGVKPAMVVETLEGIRDALDPAALVVSVAAGITTATMEAAVPNPVIRTMPNTPALVGRAVTGIAAGSRSTDADLDAARALFAAVGEAIVLPEDRIDALSAISGSGPATVFFLVEQLTTAAERLGFDRVTAKTMAEQTLIGSAHLLEATGEEPAELRRRVTSPKGTTERLIAVLEEARLADTFEAGAHAAIARARELAAGA